MTADGASAVQESARLADNLERAVAAAERLRNVQPASGGSSSSPSSGSDSAPTPKIALLASVMRTFAAETDRAVSGVQSLTGAVTAFGERAATVQGAIGQAAQTTQDNTQAQTRNAEAQRQSAQATATNARAAKASSAGILSRIGAVFGAVGKGVFTAFGVLKGAFSGIMSVIKGVASFVAAPFKLAWKGITTVFKTLLGVLGSVAAAGYGAAKILSPAGEVQRYEVQTGVMLKNPAMGRRRVAELNRYAKETNYSPAEVIGAGTQLQAFGMYSMRTLRIAGDVANVFGKKLEEVIQPLAYLKAGRTGEAFQSLSRFGVSREALKPYGVKFKKNGELETSNKKALQAVLQYFEREYNGVTERVGRTWKGTLQQLGGEVFDAMAKGFRGALEPATAYVRSHLIPTITSIGQALASLDWNRILATPMRILSGVTDIFAQLSNPQMRELGKQNLSGLWDGLKAVGWALIEGAAKVLGGVLQDLVESFGGIGGIFKAAWDGLAYILNSFSEGFTYRLAAMIPGTEEWKQKREIGEQGYRIGAMQVRTAVRDLDQGGLTGDRALQTLHSMGYSDREIDELQSKRASFLTQGLGAIGINREGDLINDFAEKYAKENQQFAVEQHLASQIHSAPQPVFPGFNGNGGKHTLENLTDAKKGFSEALEKVVEPTSRASAQTSLFRQGGQGRAFVGAMDWAMAHGSTPEQATQAARAWAELLRKQADENAGDRGRYVSGKERLRRREAQAKERQKFLMDWNDRADDERKKSEQDKARQNEKQERDNAQALTDIKMVLGVIQNLLTPIANEYKKEAMA